MSRPIVPGDCASPAHCLESPDGFDSARSIHREEAP